MMEHHTPIKILCQKQWHFLHSIKELLKKGIFTEHIKGSIKMSKATIEHLKMYQDNWERMDPAIPTQFHRAWSELYSLRNKFKEAGYDLDQDKTYELLSPGLTKAEFDEVYTRSLIFDTVNTYFRVVTPEPNSYVNGYHAPKAHELKRIQDVLIPLIKTSISEAGMPKLSAMEKSNFDILMDRYHTRALVKEMKESALNAAHDAFRSTIILQNKANMQNPNDKSTQPIQEAIAQAIGTLNLIEMAGTNYKKQEIYADYHAFGGWDKEKKKLKFSKEAAKDLLETLRLKELSKNFSLAKEFQDKGKYIVGHDMPLQSILEKMQENNMDISKAASFKGFGTTKKEFKTRYNKERKEIKKDSDYSYLIKPRINF
jgi:hypothetical protein